MQVHKAYLGAMLGLVHPNAFLLPLLVFRADYTQLFIDETFFDLGELVWLAVCVCRVP